ncbi:MAG: ABC transporter ATP-binding protein, partial [Chloroflexi bacterium]|nr:ABC transporter ATP-binding protein [Chloroflexota bacterium]
LATWEIVRGLKANGVTVVLTTHFMDEAERLADRVAIVDRGRLRALDSPGALGRLGGPAGIRFRAERGLPLDGLVDALVARGVVEEEPGEYLVDVEATPARVAALTAWLAERGVLLADLRVGRQSLEDVFLDLTTRDRR